MYSNRLKILQIIEMDEVKTSYEFHTISTFIEPSVGLYEIYNLLNTFDLPDRVRHVWK